MLGGGVCEPPVGYHYCRTVSVRACVHRLQDSYVHPIHMVEYKHAHAFL